MKALCLALLLWVSAAPVAAQRSLAIERFDAAITVNRDGTVDVAESITARFEGSWNGIYRTIPVEYHTPQGFNWTLRLELLSATGARAGRSRSIGSASGTTSSTRSGCRARRTRPTP